MMFFRPDFEALCVCCISARNVRLVFDSRCPFSLELGLTRLCSAGGLALFAIGLVSSAWILLVLSVR